MAALSVKRSIDHSTNTKIATQISGADLGGGCRGCAPPLPPEMTCGFLIQLVFCKKKTMWFIAVEVQQETSAPPPKKNPGSTPESEEIRRVKQALYKHNEIENNTVL